MKWGYAPNYNISLDSGVIGIDKCVDIISQLYDEKIPQYKGITSGYKNK